MLTMCACNICSKQEKQKGLFVGRWSKQGCISSARDYDDLKTWIRERKTAYLAARDNGWLDECCKHMKYGKTITWTLGECKDSAAKYETRGAWYKGDRNAYGAARRNGWLNDCCQHMEAAHESWTLQKCKASAAKYSTRWDWGTGDSKAYQAAVRSGWLDDCCEHIETLNINRRRWTLGECKASASKYSTSNAWQKGDPNAYRTAQKKGWLYECLEHFDSLLRETTYDECLADASNHDKWDEWSSSDNIFYLKAKSCGWVMICKDTIMQNSVVKWLKLKGMVPS
ncbi:hypothetical protein DXV75_16150 [Alteromonas aestuariivivens]|uniref:Uncharacterized protein n=2 Tax=Alteromonas aestuariivivens TaxID=1938339 RepID=A0A3D8M2X2_9ALTE|nr:hypothetical protein DXV75_16150 [Alteromonas aestuariivivens]